MTAENLLPNGPELNPLQPNPLVSIVVISLNQGHYIEETIQSILSQDYDQIELLVVDGGSTDNTLEILRSYKTDERVRWVSEPDNGPDDAYNKGINLARGEIVGLQNTSDTYQPHAISEAVLEFESDPKLALVAGYILEIDVDGEHTGDVWEHTNANSYYTVDDIVSLQGYPSGQSSFFRRDIAISIGGFAPDFNWLLTYFHLDYMLEAIRSGYRLLRVPKPWGNYRRHPNMLHMGMTDLKVGLAVVIEHKRAARDTARRYRDLLTSQQSRYLCRSGYLDELRYRVGTLHQIIPATPSLWGYFRFGGNPSARELRPQIKNWLGFLVYFVRVKVRGIPGNN